MKKYFYPILIVLALAGVASFGSCKKDNSRPVTENKPKTMDINEFANFFIDLVSRNEKDSIYAYYQDILKADSISFTPTGEPFKIADLADGTYEIIYSPALRVIVGKDDKGNFSVLKTYGLFAYDSLRMDLARRSGMLTDTVTDLMLSQRIKDDEFFKYLEERAQVRNEDILEIGEPVYYSEDGFAGRIPILNRTDTVVEANEYVINMHSMTLINGEEDNQTLMIPGRTIAPKDTIMVEVLNSPEHILRVTSIRFNMTQEQLSDKYAPLTGREYAEYLELQQERP